MSSPSNVTRPDDTNRAFRWTGDDLTDLGSLVGDETGSSNAHAVNDGGAIVGQSQNDDEVHAVRWKP
jgi:uncharacterized membrane protein